MSSEPHVIVVGAGLAGLSASLRLLQRGYRVTLYEQDDFVGGMLHSHDGHEHSYHMFMNWYHNFWAIAEEIGIMSNFAPREAFKFAYRGEYPYMPELINPGGPQDMLRNLQSGAASPPDLFLFMYSMIDLLATPIKHFDLLDEYSVNAFLRSRPYMTEGCAELHKKVWYTVWAISSSQASAASYQTFLKYGNRVPVPQLWLLTGNKWDKLLKPWMEKIEKAGGDRFRCEELHRLKQITPSGDGQRIEWLHFDRLDKSPTHYPRLEDAITRSFMPQEPEESWQVVECIDVEVEKGEYVIIAVTPGAMAGLVKDAVYNYAPGLGDIRYLESEPMGSVELHLTSKFRGLPNDVTVLMDTPYQMTFLDYSQLWPDQKNTFLYITASDVVGLKSIPIEERVGGELVLDLDHPKAAIDYLLKEFLATIPIPRDEIDLRKTYITFNTGADLFANMVGSWERRPDTETPFQNLLLAGTYVRNFADVSTIEGAVASGLAAAEAVRRRVGRGDPIEVIEPEYYPREMFVALKAAWAPYAYAAKAMSDADAWLGIQPGKVMRKLGLGSAAGYWPMLDQYWKMGSAYWDALAGRSGGRRRQAGHIVGHPPRYSRPRSHR